MLTTIANVEVRTFPTILALAYASVLIALGASECIAIQFNESIAKHIANFTLVTNESVSCCTSGYTSQYQSEMMLATCINAAKSVIVCARGLARPVKLKALLPRFERKGAVLAGLRCERISSAGVKLLGSGPFGFPCCSKELMCAIAFRQTCCALSLNLNKPFDVYCAKFVKYALSNCTQTYVSENKVLTRTLSTSAVRCLEAMALLKTIKPHLSANFVT